MEKIVATSTTNQLVFCLQIRSDDSHFVADVLHAIRDVVPRLAQVLLYERRSNQFEDFDGIVH